MKIKTKFSMGDSAFVMYNNKVVPIIIMGVHYSLDIWKGEHISYVGDITPVDSLGKFEEKYVFKTKEDLLKSL